MKFSTIAVISVYCIVVVSTHNNYTIHTSQIACGSCHTLVVTDGGKLYTWGYNSYGQLGNGNKNSSQTPVCIGDTIGT